ncbi:hypothetical protein ACFYNO_39975 [Kitasatospora sp. NPDC006697]|uniref:hypothetical protein n=1 Tax=Kitasatospora sp. NPDC006697 TaxID=3364020 RepID=UPI003689743D
MSVDGGTGTEAAERRSLLDHAARAASAGRQAVVRGTRNAARGEWALTALTTVKPPAVPAAEPWRMSIGVLLGRHPKTPALAHKALGLLDRFGAVQVGPAGVGFDGEEIPWEKVVEIRTRNAFEVLTIQALEQEVDRLRQLFPPVPGRKWVVTKAAEAIATLVLAALERGSVDQRLDELVVPVEVVHKGLLGRQRVQLGGLFAAATLAVVDPAARSIVESARQRGVPVTAAKPLAVTTPDHALRVEILRERTDAMAARLARLQSDSEAD